MQLTSEVLKKIIVGSGFVSEADFDNAVKTAAELNKQVVDVLIFRGAINEETVGKLIAEHYGLPYANIKKTSIPPEILSLVPEKMARGYRIIPFASEDKKLKLAMENPEDFEALEFAKRHT